MSCKEWNVILNEDIEDCMPMLFILCTSITGVISEQTGLSHTLQNQD